jgi:hypothetical protein
MSIITVEEAKQLVQEYMDKVKEEGYQPNLEDINHCIAVLRRNNFYVTVDGTNSIIGDVMMDGKGNPNFSVIGKRGY